MWEDQKMKIKTFMSSITAVLVTDDDYFKQGLHEWQDQAEVKTLLHRKNLSQDVLLKILYFIMVNTYYEF